MFLIEKASNSLASGIASSLNLDREREEIIAYGAFAAIQTIWSIILVMIFGVVFNVFLESLIISMAISVLRKYSGGAHSSSPNRCALIGAIASTLLALLVNTTMRYMSFYEIVILELLCFSAAYLIVRRLAPVDSEAKPIKRAERREKFKKASIRMIYLLLLVATVLGAVYYIYGNIVFLTYGFCICIGAIWQSFTLTKSGHLILGTIDRLLKKASMIAGGEKNG